MRLRPARFELVQVASCSLSFGAGDAALIVLELPERAGEERRTPAEDARANDAADDGQREEDGHAADQARHAVRRPDRDHHRRQREHDGEQRTGDGRESPQQKLRHIDEIDLRFDRREIEHAS